MVTRLVIILRIAAARGIAWMFENPASSLIQFHTRMLTFLHEFGSYFVQQVWLGMYGAETVKSVRLWSSESWVHKLYKPLNKAIFKKAPRTSKTYFNKLGRKCYHGTKALKDTQAKL